MPLVLGNPAYHGGGRILDDPSKTYIAGLVISSTDANMQRQTDFTLVCTGSTEVPTVGNTTLVSGNDTLTPSSVTGSDPYTITFPVGDLSKQVDPTGYVWTLNINSGSPESTNSDPIPLVIQSGWSSVTLSSPIYNSTSLLNGYSPVGVNGDHLEYILTSVLDSGVSESVDAATQLQVTEAVAGDWLSPIRYNVRLVQVDGTISSTESVSFGSPNDTEKPVITLTGASTINITQGSSYTELGATWTDNADGSGAAVVSGTVDINTVGAYVISYDYTDAAGNVADTVTRTVNVNSPDTQPPVITLTGDSTVILDVGATYVEQGATWTDDIDGTGAVVDIADNINNSVVGDYTVTYNYTDGSGKAATEVIRTVQVRDISKPVITINGSSNITLEGGSSYTELGATWTDNADGSGNATVTGTVDTFTVGTYLINYDYTDNAGNVADTVTRTVVIEDTTPPTIVLQGFPTVVVEVNGIFNDEGAIWTDIVDGSGYAEVSGNLDLTIPGSYWLTYSYTDTSGNVGTPVVRNVIVAKAAGSDDGGRYLALSKETHDLIKPFGGGVSRVVNGRFVVQQVKCKLRTWLGEWVLDSSIGWINQNDFERNFDLADLERRARTIILGTDGVLSIINLTSKYSNRKLTLEFKAKTKYGVIELIVPWGVQ